MVKTEQRPIWTNAQVFSYFIVTTIPGPHPINTMRKALELIDVQKRYRERYKKAKGEEN